MDSPNNMATSFDPHASRPHRKWYIEHTLRLLAQQESAFLGQSIQRAKNQQTQLTKANLINTQHHAIDAAHKFLQ
jgi:hypothetical protein